LEIECNQVDIPPEVMVEKIVEELSKIGLGGK